MAAMRSAGASLGGGLKPNVAALGGGGDLGAGIERGDVRLEAVDGGDAFGGREPGGVIEPNGEHGFIGGTEEAGGLALQGVVQGGQFAGHVGGVAFGVGLGAFGGKAHQGGGLAESQRAGSDDLEEEGGGGDRAVVTGETVEFLLGVERFGERGLARGPEGDRSLDAKKEL